jgi:aminoglycoside 6'-N-acetyltransferase I
MAGDAPPPFLRSATAGDLEELVLLAREFYDEDGFSTSDADLRENFTALLRSPNARIVVAVSDTDPYAFALTTTDLVLESGVVAELQDLYVRPAHRRRGVAGALIDDAIAWARVRTATLLELVVAPNGRDVSHLLRYYAERGFVDEDRRILGRWLG